MSEVMEMNVVTNASLFERLGGSAGIKALVDEIVALHMINPVAGVRFQAYLDSPERVATIKRHVCEFLEMGSGGPAKYNGRSMTEAHRGMNINEMEFVAIVDDMMAAMRKQGIDEQGQKDVLAISWSLKGEVLHL